MNKTLVLLTALALLTVLAPTQAAKPDGVGNAAQANGPPGGEVRTLEMELTGTALATRTGEMLEVTIEVTGDVTLKDNNGNGNGKGFSGRGLDAEVTITRVDEDGNNETVESFTREVKIHGMFSSYLGQGLDGFRYNLQTTGKPSAPVNHFGLHGNTTGVENGTYSTLGSGHANIKYDRATNYRLDVAGTAELRE